QLQSKINNFKIEAFPDNPENYQVIHINGAILVHYAGAKFSDTKTDDLIVQDVNPEFDIYLKIRGLHGNTGCYAALKLVRDALTGFCNDEFKKMYPVEEKCLGEEGGIWEYMITFRTEMIAIELDS
ncbi:MAG: Gp37 family protein, partial [Pseudomonadota bacterium]